MGPKTQAGGKSFSVPNCWKRSNSVPKMYLYAGLVSLAPHWPTMQFPTQPFPSKSQARPAIH